MKKTDEAQENGHMVAPTGFLGTESLAAAKTEGRARKQQLAQLESQDDLGYVTGYRESKEKDKQVKTPAPRRQPSKSRESTKGDRR
jgi:hypothetical protein